VREQIRGFEKALTIVTDRCWNEASHVGLLRGATINQQRRGPHHYKRAVGAIAAVVMAGGLGAAAAPVSSASAAAPANGTHNPAHNVPPHPSYQICYESPKSSVCRHKEIAATDHVRHKEHVRKLHLPHNYSSLSFAKQGFVLMNLERVDRGLRPFKGMVAQLNKEAKKGAKHDEDPMLPKGYKNFTAAGSNWAEDANPLAANYGWMYMDGPGGENEDCQPGFHEGCWGHRDNILGHYDGTLIVGCAEVKQGSEQSSAQLFVASTVKHHHFTYTWHQAVKHGAGH
jgi:hypothetical protein